MAKETKRGLEKLNDDMLRQAKELPDGHPFKQALMDRYKEMQGFIDFGEALGEWDKFDKK